MSDPTLTRVTSPDPATDPVPPWEETEYRRVVAGLGASKLQDSRVAPLVAAARGYWHADRAANKICATLAGADLRSRAGAQIRTAVDGRGAMVMPRYTPADGRTWAPAPPDTTTTTDTTVAVGAGAGVMPITDLLTPARIELKPVDPRIETDRRSGKTRTVKYESLIGRSAVIDLHPATPRDWDSAPVVLITEGTLKGDAAVTALLLANGVTHDELGLAGVTPLTQRHALTVLRALMGRVPADRRTLIVTVTGVGNWHNNPEWAEVNPRQRKVWVAFDGDVRSNPAVWDQTHQMWNYLTGRGADVKLLDLNPTTGNDDGGDTGKGDATDRYLDDPEPVPTGEASERLGLDDYLRQVGGWDTLPPLLRQELPTCPGGPAPTKGTVDVDEDRCVVRVWAVQTDLKGNSRSGWRVTAPLAGRVVSIYDQRHATAAELRSGTVDSAQDGATQATTVIEVYWRDSDGDRVEHRITGPDSLLVDNPATWHSERVGGNVPSAVKAHPAWPCDMKWLAAIKANRAQETIRQSRWGHMGWVPTDDGRPVFIVGDQVIGQDGMMPGAAVPGVSTELLAKADLFGVIEPANDDALRTAVRNVVDAYRQVWADPRYAAIALATALRPTVPLPYNTPVMAVGASGKGKSHLASLIMSFWQNKPGTWEPHRLPGSMMDSPASIHHFTSLAPIWVIDDLAPSADDRRAKSNEAGMEDMLRSIFNQSGPGRMALAPGAVRQRKQLPPRAVVIATAENEVSTSSASNRAVTLHFQQGSLLGDEVNAANRIRSVTGEAAMVTFGVLRTIASCPVIGTWEEDMRYWAVVKRTLADSHVFRLDAGPGAQRSLDMATDLSLGLVALGLLAQQLGMGDVYDLTRGWVRDVFDHVHAEMLRGRRGTPGNALLAALRSALRAGVAHVEDRDTPTQPPLTQGESVMSAAMLGWQASGDGGLRPSGTRIGWLTDKDGKKFVLLDPATAFKVAQRHQPELIPYGSKHLTSWTAAWAEGLTAPDGQPWKRHRAGRYVRPVVRAYGMEVVPFPLEHIVGAPDDQKDVLDDG